MGDKDFLDRCFDFAEKKTKWLYQSDLIKNWFNLISWTALTAIVLVMSKTSGSYFLGFVGFISFVLVFFYGWHTLFETVIGHLKESENIGRATMVFVILASVSAPACLLYYMFQAIRFLVDKNV